jgi:WD40 repeat protein
MITDLAFSTDGKTLASASWDKTIKLWNVDDAKFDRETSPYRTLTGHTGGVTSVSFNPNAPVLASGSQDTTIKLWETQDGTALKTLLRHQDAVKTTLFSTDGSKLVSTSDRTGMIVWNFNLIDLLQQGCDQLRQLDSRPTSQQLKNPPYADPQVTIDNSIDNSGEMCSASKS